MTPASPIAPSTFTPAESVTARYPAPLAPAAIGLAVGIAIDNACSPPLGVFVGFALAALAGLLLKSVRRRFSWLIASVAAVGLGGILHDNFYRRVPPDHIVRYVTDRPIIARVSGTVLSSPRKPSRRKGFFSRWNHHPEVMRFTLAASQIEAHDGPIHVSGLVAVTVSGLLRDVKAGDGVSVYGLIYRPSPPANPGQFDYARWLRLRRVHVALRCTTPDNVTVRQNPGNRLLAALGRFRTWLHALLTEPDRNINRDERGLVETMVLGRRYAVNPRIEALFERLGATHYLAVSGLHVGVVGGFIWLLGRTFGGTRRRCALVVVVAIVAYACLVDPRPPIFRAAIIGVLFCIGIILRRTASVLNSLALAAIILLCFRPTMLFEPAFQMSFAAVLGMLFLSAPLLAFFRQPFQRWFDRLDPGDENIATRAPSSRPARRVYLKLLGFQSICVVACLASTPFVATYFGHIAPLAPVNSVILFPFFAATLLLGMLTVAIGIVAPVLLPVFKCLTDLSAQVLLWVAEILDHVFPDLRGGWALMIQLVYISILVLLVGSVRIGDMTTWTRLGAWGRKFLAFEDGTLRRRRVASILLAISLLVVIPWLPSKPGPAALRLTQLSVGLGTSTVIRFPDGTVWLYDCGTNGAYDVGAGTIVPFCNARHIKRIDRVFISHPNMDHFNGIFSVMDSLETGPVVLNRHFGRFSPPDGPAQAMLEELQRRRHAMETLAKQKVWSLPGGVKVEVLWPPAKLPPGVSTNDISTVIRLTYRGASVLMCGDIEESAMAALLGHGGLSADVLVLPHHGSLERNTADFIAAVNPMVCLRSSNQRLRDTSSERLAAIGGRTVLDTADEGALTLIIDEKGPSISGFRHSGSRRDRRHSAWRIPDDRVDKLRR